MSQNIVSKELAAMLKEVGYSLPTHHYYHPKVKDAWHSIEPVNYNTQIGLSDLYISAPDLNSVCDWLREVHGLHIYEIQDKYGKWQYLIEEVPRTPKVWHNMNYAIYELAQTAAITHAIQLLTDKMGK